MRTVIFALLSAIPVALTGWVVWLGQKNGSSGVRDASSDAAVATISVGVPDASSNADASLNADAVETGSAGSERLETALRAMFFPPLPGALVRGEVVLYDGERLFDYIDGAAPLYLERGFRRLAAAELAIVDGGGELTCDVYDMGGAENAASIAKAERSPSAKEAPSWPAAWSGPLSFVFHHDRYYVKLTAFDAGAEARLPALARALVERMR